MTSWYVLQWRGLSIIEEVLRSWWGLQAWCGLTIIMWSCDHVVALRSWWGHTIMMWSYNYISLSLQGFRVMMSIIMQVGWHYYIIYTDITLLKVILQSICLISQEQIFQMSLMYLFLRNQFNILQNTLNGSFPTCAYDFEDLLFTINIFSITFKFKMW